MPALIAIAGAGVIGLLASLIDDPVLSWAVCIGGSLAWGFLVQAVRLK